MPVTFGLPVAVLDSPVRWLGSPSPHHSPQLPDSPAGFLESARLSGGLRSAPFSSTRTEAILVTHSAISQRTPVTLQARGILFDLLQRGARPMRLEGFRACIHLVQHERVGFLLWHGTSISNFRVPGSVVRQRWA